MELCIHSKAAQRYGLTGAATLAYLIHREQDGHDNEGRFAAPWPELNKAFRLTRSTFDRQRDRLEDDGLIHTRRLPHLTLYVLNHEAISQLTGCNDG